MKTKIFSTIIAAMGFFVVFTAASCATAQNRGFRPARQSPDQLVSVLKERLSLTEEQAAQVLPIMTEEMEKRKALHDKYKSMGRQGRDIMRSEMQKSREDTQTRLEAILTPEQMDAFKKFQDEQRNKRGKRGNRRG